MFFVFPVLISDEMNPRNHLQQRDDEIVVYVYYVLVVIAVIVIVFVVLVLLVHIDIFIKNIVQI